MTILQVKPEIFSDIHRNSLSAGANIANITFDTDTLVLCVDLIMESGTLRAKDYFYSNIYFGEWDLQSFMQHVRNIVATIAKHHATLDTIVLEDFKRAILY